MYRLKYIVLSPYMPKDMVKPNYFDMHHGIYKIMQDTTLKI